MHDAQLINVAVHVCLCRILMCAILVVITFVLYAFVDVYVVTGMHNMDDHELVKQTNLNMYSIFSTRRAEVPVSANWPVQVPRRSYGAPSLHSNLQKIVHHSPGTSWLVEPATQPWINLCGMKSNKGGSMRAGV